MTMFERKTIAMARPHLAAAADAHAPHRKAFDAYLRGGDDDGLRGLELEGKALNTAVAGDGGYLVDPQTSEMIHSVLSSTASIRAVANVVAVEATSFDVLVDHADVGHGWATETGTVTETDTPVIDRISIPLHELSALPKASQRLLDDSAFDVEAGLRAASPTSSPAPRLRPLSPGTAWTSRAAFLDHICGRQRCLGLGQYRLHPHRGGWRYRRARSDHRHGLCAGRAVPRQRAPS